MITYSACHDLEVANVIFYQRIVLLIMLLLLLKRVANISEKGHSESQML